jgi:hypothetical protein
MQHTRTPSGGEYHLFLSATEWHTLRGYLRRAQRKGIVPGPLLATMLRDMGAEEETT